MNLCRNILFSILFVSSVVIVVNTVDVRLCLSGNNDIETFCRPDFLQQSDSLKIDTLASQDSLKVENELEVANDSTIIMLVDSIIEYGKTFLGVPYCHGHGGPDMFDCSGFTSYVFRRFGYELSRSSSGQLANGWKIIDNQNDLQAGDLVFYGGRKNYHTIGHVGIVIENCPEENYFRFIHATISRGVIISKSNEKYYIVRYIKGCRVLPEYY